MAMTKIWAHRGASARLAENTMPAFEEAVRLGADGIELDVQLSSDGQLIVIHDEKTDRTTGISGWVHQLTANKLKKLNAAAFRPQLSSTHVPRLEEVLDLLKNTEMTLNIELKNGLVQTPGMEEKVWQAVSASGMQDRVVFSSFNHYSLRMLLEFAPQAKCGLLYQSGLVDPWMYAQRVGATAIHPWYGNLQIPDLISNCHNAGIAVHVWTLNDDKKIKQAAALEVDAIITDIPERALQLLQEG
ncbi:MAG: glycerophosphodiester phosphodiesterase [Eubacteriales bacterium]|nr:glycerophosphodiester phosphodiesterase [Eubacteriales bacterium]MDD3196652.1 glycerophosphodiester phosphodiesterase [Eubacteriales bacterium]MDD3502631.1 glycerophosphodiester phosphodiesterase [Eubacteriales bacterium]MDD4682278.1 glycerophosphodiester phosphodiesterase [Eubacteriales bacterium]